MSFQEHLDRAHAAQKGLRSGISLEQRVKLSKELIAAGQDKAKVPDTIGAIFIPLEFQVVESSNILAMRFDVSLRQQPCEPDQLVGHVELLFHSGQLWRYGYLRAKDYNALLTAPSIGKHFHKNIKPRVARGELTAKLLQKP